MIESDGEISSSAYVSVRVRARVSVRVRVRVRVRARVRARVRVRVGSSGAMPPLSADLGCRFTMT